MPATLIARCPGCKNDVRMPEDWATKAVRCRHCGMVAQAKLTPSGQAKLAALKPPPVAATPARPVTMAAPPPAPAHGVLTLEPAAPMGMAPRPSGGDPFSQLDLDAPVSAPVTTGRYRAKKRSFVPILIAFFFFVVCVGGTVAGIFFLGPKIKEGLQATNQPTEKGATEVTSANPTSGAVGTGGKMEFPRRLLGISVNNYLYANTTSYGTDPAGRFNRDFGAILLRLGNTLKIPKSQIFELSDGAAGKTPIPPLKPIIERTVEQYCATSRAQDRVILIFCGHSIEIEGKPYLVPLEGDLKEEKTLIPLEWLMKQVGECKAQQKILVMDLNRYDPARGFERLSGGKLAAKTEEMLKNPPEGVQVVSACSKDQYSHEADDYDNFQGFEMKGGIFLNYLARAMSDGVGGIQKENDPIAIEPIAQRTMKFVKERYTRVTKNEKGETVTVVEQVPFMAGAPKGESLAYNQDEPAAQPISIPTPDKVFTQGLASTKDMAAILDEVMVPPAKAVRDTGKTLRFETIVPFSLETMKNYKEDRTVEEILNEADKYPLRVATIKAIQKLREIGKSSRADLPDEIKTPATDAFKATLRNLQRGPARIMADLKELLEALEKAGEERKEEKSKRWQAHYDFVVAQVKMTYAYTHEYSLMTGIVRRDALPELDKEKSETGWRLAASDNMLSNKDVKDQVSDARKLLKKLIKEHPGTPWEVLAKREQDTSYGLKWVPTNFGGEVAMANPK